uniref:Uncharacterized protein n=1 Tax=Ananas comosus var. bracteatus TaxID=296719 RepID=A0A6V7NIE8_ANACO|nr:unnamed protein product [Ananas comosus var. bracteatus]
MYRNSVVENEEIKRQVIELLESGAIKPSSFPCGSPIVLVPKKDGGWRMCIDYRALNKITIKNWYPLPRIDDLLDELKHARYFTKLDLNQSWEEHLEHVKKVFKLLEEHQLRLNPKKCEYGKQSLVYLRFVVGGGELQIDPDKVRAIKEWLRPKNVTEVRSFMGACQYVRKFIRHFSVLAAPLHALMKANQKFEWNSKHEDTFRLLLRKICEALVLALPNLQRPFELEADASGYAMGAVLMQDGWPIVYYSEMFQGAQKNYPTYDKKLLALHQAVKHWQSEIESGKERGSSLSRTFEIESGKKRGSSLLRTFEIESGEERGSSLPRTVEI